jgi:hypothetical protein
MTGSLYGYGYPRPGMPDTVKPANPLPANKMCMETGDAAQDGYSVLSCADRVTGRRPAIGDRDPNDTY